LPGLPAVLGILLPLGCSFYTWTAVNCGLEQDGLNGLSALRADIKRQGGSAFGYLSLAGILLAHRLRRLMDGELEVSSTPGEGCRFFFAFASMMLIGRGGKLILPVFWFIEAHGMLPAKIRVDLACVRGEAVNACIA
jgi:hypothetical protein